MQQQMATTEPGWLFYERRRDKTMNPTLAGSYVYNSVKLYTNRPPTREMWLKLQQHNPRCHMRWLPLDMQDHKWTLTISLLRKDEENIAKFYKELEEEFNCTIVWSEDD